MSGTRAEREGLEAFLAAYWADWDRDEVRPLADYLRAFPGVEEAVAREFVALEQDAQEAGEDAVEEPDDEARIGPYVLDRELGRGGQATVWLARDERLGRWVALKVYHARVALTPGTVEQIRREVDVAFRLDHPALCVVHDLGHDDGRYWIAMQFVPGEPLSARIARAERYGVAVDPRPEEERRHGASDRERWWALALFFERLARAVHAAHEADVVHRDLKPQNIMVRPDGRPVVLDFGLAQAERFARNDDGESPSGTPAFMAPEQLRGGAVDRRSDVYALGLVLRACVLGRRPAADEDDRSVDDPAVPADLRAILACALATEPDRRYATARAFADDLRRMCDYEPLQARPATPPLRVRRWAQRNPVLAAVVLVGTLLSILGLVVLARSNAALRGANERLATERDRSTRALAVVSRLKASRTLERLEHEATLLWPADPPRIAPLRGWLRDAEDVLGTFDSCVATLRDFERRADAESVGEAAAIGAEGAVTAAALAGRRDWTFSADEDPVYSAWLHGVLVDVVTRMLAFRAPETGLVADVRRRLGVAEAIAHATLGEHADAWRGCRERVGSASVYGGLDLEPQLGLVPLGPDPESGLEEFLVWATQAADVPAPTRSASGELELDERNGVVLVLLPGGTFWMGADAALAEPDGDPSHVDPHARRGERPVHAVTLAPFFLGKHELSQAQWMRIRRADNPSILTRKKHGDPFTLLHPVEFVDWYEATETLHRVGLVLPTEAQWEYAVRAGTRTVFFAGDDVASMLGAFNLADTSAVRMGVGLRRVPGWPEFDDGWPFHAPVHSGRPNGFGLHHMPGNVWEWCRDAFEFYLVPATGPDGARPGDSDPTRKIIRGGSWQLDPGFARSASRDVATATDRQADGGVRAARPLDPGSR